MIPRRSDSALNALARATRTRPQPCIHLVVQPSSSRWHQGRPQSRSTSSAAHEERSELSTRAPAPKDARPRKTRYGAGSTAAATVASSKEKHPGAVYVRISPRPETLAESKQVLDILRRFGDVQMYRHLKYMASAPAPNRAVAIFRSPEAAQSAIAASPIEFTLGGDIPGFDSAWTADEKFLDQLIDGPAAAEPSRSGVKARTLDDGDLESELTDANLPARVRQKRRRAARLKSAADEGEPSEDSPIGIDSPSWAGHDELDFLSDLDRAQGLVTQDDPEAASSIGHDTAIQPPWETQRTKKPLQSPPAPSEDGISVQASPTATATDSTSTTHTSPPSSTSPSQTMPSSPSFDIVNPSNPIALPRLPSTPPKITPAPAYRYSGISAPERQQPALQPPTYDDDPAAHPPPRPARLIIQASGLAHNVFNARQPYFAGFKVPNTSYPGEAVLGDLPPGLHGLCNSDLRMVEHPVGLRQRIARDRTFGDFLEGKSLGEIWREADHERYG